MDRRDAVVPSNVVARELGVAANTDRLDSGDLTQGAGVPEAGADLRIQHAVADALAATPGGEGVARYFGTDGATPVPTTAAAAESDALIGSLRGTITSQGDVAGLFARIAAHTKASAGAGLDPDAVRALYNRQNRT